MHQYPARWIELAHRPQSRIVGQVGALSESGGRQVPCLATEQPHAAKSEQHGVSGPPNQTLAPQRYCPLEVASQTEAGLWWKRSKSDWSYPFVPLGDREASAKVAQGRRSETCRHKSHSPRCVAPVFWSRYSHWWPVTAIRLRSLRQLPTKAGAPPRRAIPATSSAPTTACASPCLVNPRSPASTRSTATAYWLSR
jgi:hypothetical protein